MSGADKTHKTRAHLELFLTRLMRTGDSIEFVEGGTSTSSSTTSSTVPAFSIPLPECLINEVPDHQKTAELLRHFMATGPRLEVMGGSGVDPVFEELCQIDWTLNSIATAISKLSKLRKKAVAAIVSIREDLALEEIAERADEIERSVGHAVTLSRWMGLCVARKMDVLGMMVDCV